MKALTFILFLIGFFLILLLPLGPSPLAVTAGSDASTDSRPDSLLWACCHPINYECFLFTEAQCDSIDGIWFEGEGCDPAP